MSKLFFIVFLIFSFSAFAQSEEDIVELKALLQSDLPIVENIAEDLMRVYSPEKYLYVTIGSSPVVLQTHFAIHHPAVDIVNIPLTGLGGGYLYSPDPDLNLETSIVEQRLLDFVGKNLDSRKIGIVLIDYVNTGRTLLRAFNIARNYFHKQQIVTYALFKTDAQKLEWDQRGRRGITVGSNSFGLHLHRGKYNLWPEYLSVDYRKDQVVRNTWFPTLLKEMKKITAGATTPLKCSHLF